MSAQTSEQALSALEHSTKPAAELLDSAAEIIGFGQWQGQVGVGRRPINASSIDVAAFRHQWVLRWLIKRLSQATKAKAGNECQDPNLLLDQRTWLLLRHLLETIPDSIAKDTLVERSFCRVFDASIRCVLRLVDGSSEARSSSSDESPDRESGRPTKKRKLASASISRGAPAPGKRLHDLLDVAGKAAHILKTGASDSDSDTRRAPANWIDSVEAAASLVGSVLRAADRASNVADEEDGSDVASSVPLMIGEWLSLWHAYTSATHSSSKQDPHASFNKHVLVPALSILQQQTSISNPATSTALERQIAMHAIIPSRALFYKKHASKWESWTTEPAETEIMPLILESVKGLEAAAESLSSSDGDKRAALLLNIAARLVPRSDAVKRKAERIWLEALFMGLSYLIQPHRSDHKDSLYDEAEERSSAVSSSTKLLDTLQDAAVQPSQPILRSYVRHAVLNSSPGAPYDVLSRVTKLNASVFVPESSEGGTSFLQELGTLVTEHRPTTADEHIQLVQEILTPAIEEVGKSRKLPQFISFWQARLVDTFHDRLSSIAKPDFNDQKHVWNDPSILDTFSAVCQRYATPSLCMDMLGTVRVDLEGLPTIVGPTHRVFARITTCIQMLKAQGSVPLVQEFLSENAPKLRDATCAALRRSNDYQGQRWLLWKLLDVIAVSETLLGSDETLDLHGISSPLHDQTLPAIKDFWTPQDRAILAEQLYYFGVVCAVYEANVHGGRVLFENAMSDLKMMIEKHLEEGAFQVDETTTWTGSVDNMNNAGTLLSAIMQRLAVVPVVWLSHYQSSQQFIRDVVRLTFYIKGCKKHIRQQQSCVTQSAEALLTAIFASTDVDPIDVYLEAVKGQDDRQQAKRLPSFLYAQSSGGANKGQSHKLVQVLLRGLQQHSEHMTHACLADYMSFLSTVCSKHAISPTLKSSFTSFVSCLEVSTNGADLELLALASQSINRITEVLVKRSSTADGDQQAAIVDWAKRRLKTADSRKNGGILDQYDWFVLLTVIQSIPFLNSSPANHDVQKACSKLEKRYREMATAASKRLCKVKPGKTLMDAFMDEKSSFKAWKLIDALMCLDEDKAEQSLETTRLLDELLRIGRLDGDVYATILNRLENMAKSHEVDFAMKAAAANLNPNFISPMCCKSVALQARLAAYQQVHQQLPDKKRYLDLTHEAKLDVGDHVVPDSVMQSYLFAAGYVKSLTPDEIASSPELLSIIGQLASLQYRIEAPTALTLLARLELSKIIFEKHPAMINQNIVDNTLASIALLASAINKLILTKAATSPRPHHIYDRLCNLILTLLTRYRRRFTDRHHLLIPALQNLLKCLFYPPTRAHLTTTRETYPSKAVFLASLPNWLNPPSHTSTTTLPPTSASKLSRILQTLCDPSTSAARHTLRRNTANNLNLTDETRQLRQQVSLHTQYLLITYTQATLDGYISPEVKEKLLPGLYSVLNATDVEVLRGMNASMDGSQRDVWKDLYAEWGRYGRWNRR